MAAWGVRPPNKRVTAHFHWQTEAACKHCGRVVSLEVVRATAEWLERVRERLGNRVLHVNSWCRCPVHNKAIGGAPESYHLKGMAVDIVARGLTAHQTWEECFSLQLEGLIGGLGKYASFVHVDRGPKRNWNGP